MPNAIIVASTVIIIGNAILHCRHDSEVEDKAAVDGIIEDDVDDEEEDMVEDNKVLKEFQSMLL